MDMRKYLLFISLSLFFTGNRLKAQIDPDHIDIQDLTGKVMIVQKGFAPKFFIGGIPIDKITRVADILGMKQNEQIDALFKTFRTGRTIYKVAAYTGGAVAVYSIARKLNQASGSSGYNAALYSGLGAIASGLAVKLLTKGASYEAVDIFNGIAVKTIKSIFSIGMASDVIGVALYVKL